MYQALLAVLEGHCCSLVLSTVRRFGLLQPYLGHPSRIPFVCITHKVQGMLDNLNQNVVEKLPSFVKLEYILLEG